jgi:ankyrin repeat protein
MVNLLLEKGIDVNITDDYNNTALSAAAINAEYDVVKLLLEKGADINKKNDDGDTPLIHAINFGYIDMVQLLLEHPDINIELDLDTNKELRLAEDLTPEDEEQNGIAYLIENYIETKNQIKKQKDDNIKELSNYKRRNIPSLSTLAYHQCPTDVDTIFNQQLLGMNRPYGKLGRKRRTRKYKRSTAF